MRKTILFLTFILACSSMAVAQESSFVGDWTGRWSYSKWDPDSDTKTLASGYTVVRIQKAESKYIVRIKEVEDSSEPQITYYLPELKTVSVDDTFIEVAYRYAEWGTRKIQLRMHEGYISMSSTMEDEERNLTGRMCPIMIARNHSDGWAIISLDSMPELKLFKENDW